MPRAEKEAKVREIAEQLKSAEAAVLTGYRGLTVQDSGELRAALADVDTRLSVVKNSLAMLAVKEAGFDDLTRMFDGPTAVAYIKGDAVAAAKRMVEQARRFPVLEIRGGFAEGRILDADQIRSLATLDTREVMLAKLAGLGKMQMARAAFMFQALQSRFALLLQALKEKLPEAPADEAAPAEAEPATGGEEPAAEPAASAEEPAGEAAAPAEDEPDAERPADTPAPETTPDEPEPAEPQPGSPEPDAQTEAAPAAEETTEATATEGES
jgi:large subunit ribosomal protein L10